jgi:hypothetical protein
MAPAVQQQQNNALGGEMLLRQLNQVLRVQLELGHVAPAAQQEHKPGYVGSLPCAVLLNALAYCV